MDIYENLVIGTFLYGFGAAMALRNLSHGTPETFVGNFQQMPMDECYADLMVRNPGIFRLIEFKRETARLDKETAKLRMLENGLASKIFEPSDVEQLRAISRTIHWYVESPREKALVHTVRVVPYLDFPHVKQANRVLLADFVEDLAEEASAGTKTEDEMCQYEWYLSLLCTCRGSDSSALVILITGDGRILIEPMPDVRDLIRPKWERIHRGQELEIALSESWEQKLVDAYTRVQSHLQIKRTQKEIQPKIQQSMKLSPF